MIILDNVTKTFQQRVALDHVSLCFASGLTHVLLGSSGCGKSTLLRLILGLHTPDSGTITVAGTPTQMLTREALATQMGYVVQEGGLFPHLTASQNVALPAEARKWPPQRRRDRIAELAQMVGFSESMLQLYPAQLSGGQRQRVGLMRSLMLNPDVLLLDEPLASLDPITRDDLQQQLRTIFRTLGKTVVLVTHDLREAAVVGDTITLMTQGKVVQHGTFTQLLQEPATPFVTAFMRAQQPPSMMKEYL